MTWIEILGYAASLLVAVSLSMKSLARLRALNLLGSVAFAVYGLVLGVYPVMVVNAYIAVINVVFLMRMQPGHSEAFSLLAIGRADNGYLRRFLEFHARDIARYFPDFDPDRLAAPRVVFILRDMLPVGLVIGHRDDQRNLIVDLDYVIPSHRDFRCAEYFYRAWRSVMDDDGIEGFLTRSEVDAHRRYLKKLNFQPARDIGEHWYLRPA
ncbi:hypothetical protein CO151_00945 [bacterium CG_4_9_14_3_um_filter_65_15]|nr:MAG: hypothetical protein CO151_00945 [bacterium CG_4_9_14_3_um_filter_65_15]